MGGAQVLVVSSTGLANSTLSWTCSIRTGSTPSRPGQRIGCLSYKSFSSMTLQVLSWHLGSPIFGLKSNRWKMHLRITQEVKTVSLPIWDRNSLTLSQMSLNLWWATAGAKIMVVMQTRWLLSIKKRTVYSMLAKIWLREAWEECLKSLVMAYKGWRWNR